MYGDRADALADKWLPLNTTCTAETISPASIIQQLFEMDVNSKSQSSKRKVCKDKAIK